MSKLEVDTIDTKTGTNSLTIKQNDTAAITIDTSQSVGIGTTTPSTGYGGTISNVKLALRNDGTGGNNGTSTLLIGGDNNHYSYLSSEHTGGGATYLAFGTASGASNPVERSRIDSSGRLLVGTTSYSSTSDGTSIRGTIIEQTSNSDFNMVLAKASGASQTTYIFFNYNNGLVGYINYNGSGVNYNVASDYRLKENVIDLANATARVKQLKPKRFNFIASPDTTLDGFLAHEVSDIVPEAITGTKDETETKEKVVVNSSGQVIAKNIEEVDWENGKIADEDGNTKYPIDSTWEATKIVPVYQGIDQSKLVPLLTASLQEAIAKIEELETRIATLENA